MNRCGTWKAGLPATPSDLATGNSLSLSLYNMNKKSELLVAGRSIPKIIGQLRDARHRWAEEEQRLDEEELEAFEELERLEQELEVKLKRRERDETESQRQFFVQKISERKAQLQDLTLHIRNQSQNLELLKTENAKITQERAKNELWEARVQIGYLRENDAQTGVEEIFEGDGDGDDEDFIFTNLPEHIKKKENAATNHAPQSPGLDPEACAEKQRRMRILTLTNISELPRASQEGRRLNGETQAPEGEGWIHSGQESINLAERKHVGQKMLHQLKQHIRLLTKSRSEAMAARCPVPITNAIARALDEVGQLDEQWHDTEDFLIWPPPQNNLLLTDFRRKTWAYKMKVAIECRLRLLVIVKNELKRLALNEMAPPEPIFADGDKTFGEDEKKVKKQEAVKAKSWCDELAGPDFDYDYAFIDAMGHPGLVGFSIMTKASLQPLRDQHRSVQQMKWDEKNTLRRVMEAADAEYSAHQQSLDHEMNHNSLYQERRFQGIKEAHHLDSLLQINEEELMVLRRKRDEAEVNLTRVTRQQLRVVLIVWRAFTCKARPEEHPASATHAHVQRLITSQELPPYVMPKAQRERPVCKRNLAAMAQEARELGGLGGEELVAVQPWLGACFAPPDFKGQMEGKEKYLCEGLELEHVYGYRGHDCRANIFQMRSGEALFHAGSFGIIQNLEEGPDQHRQIWLRGVHKGQISCCALHPDGFTVATAESASSVDDYPMIYIWRGNMASGEVSLLQELNHPKDKKAGLLEGVISCIAFSKGGRCLVAIGDRWPHQSLVIYEWSVSSNCGATIKHDLGRQKALSLAVNPYSDTIVVTGDRFLNVMYSPDDRKKQYREVVGQLRWELLRADVQYQTSETVVRNSDDVQGGVLSKRERDALLFQHPEASGKSGRSSKAFKEDIFGLTAEQDEAGRNISTVSEAGFKRLKKFIQDCAQSAKRAMELKQPVSAIAECKCALRSCEQLLELVDQGLVREHSVQAVVDSIGPRQAVIELQNDIKFLLLASMDSMQEHQANFERTYEIDVYLQSQLKEMRTSFAHLLDGAKHFLEDTFRRTEAGLNELIEVDKSRQLCVESCHNYTRLGAAYWKVNTNSPFLHAPKMQAIFCVVFTGPYTFITGTEEGSLYFWDGSEMVGAASLHDDAIIDMSIDLTGFESQDCFHLITASYDGTVRLSRCDRFEQGLRDQHYFGIVLMQIDMVVLPTLTGQPSPAVSVSNVFGLDKFSGLPCIEWAYKPSGYPFFTMSSGVSFSVDEVSTRRHTFLVGTSENKLYYISFDKLESPPSSSITGSTSCVTILEAQRGTVTCVSAHPKKPTLMFSGGEDGFARMWDVAERKLKMSYCVRNSAINCSDFSVSGDVIAVGLSKGGFLILDSDTLLPQAQVVFEFEVLVISEGNDGLSCTTSAGPLSESDRVLLRKLDRLKVQRQYLDRGKGKQAIPEESLLELENVVAEIQAIQDTISSKQKRFFKGSYFALDSLTSISRRRSQIAELKLARFSGLLSKPQHRELVTLENQEQQQQRLLISDIDLNLSQLNCLIKFASPSWNSPSGRATVQKFDEEVKHSKRSILVVKFSPDNRMLAVAGVDMIVYVHQRLCLGEITCKVAGHTAPIRNIDWGGDSRHFQTNSENHELRFWKLIKPERKAWNAEELRAKQIPDDLSWSSWTCPMGWPVLGIQPTDGMAPRIDISVHSIFNHNGSLLISGDSSCCITLTRFPCPSMDQMRKIYKGHCSPIIAVQFIAGGFKVVSCGKSDSCIVQWKILNEPEPIETQEKITGPVVVLHGDVSSKHEAKCAICSDANNKYSILEEIQAKVVKEMLPIGGDYGGDLERQLQAYQKEMEDQGGTEIPALPLDSDMIQLNGWSDEIGAQTPLEDMELEHVFGYQGSDRKCNAKLLRTGELVYTAGCIAIVSNMSSRQQRQFIHHLSPIVSFAVHPDKLTICSASNGPRPSIFIWDSLTMEVQHNLQHCFPEPGYSIVAFGGHSGEKVLVVGNDDFHSLAAIMWKTEDVLVMGTGTQRDAVTGLIYNEFALADDAFVPNLATIGEQNIIFWDLCFKNIDQIWSLSKLMADFRPKSRSSMASGIFVGPLTLLTGSYEGELYIWDREKLVEAIKGHSGPIFDMKLNVHQDSLITCSSDGMVKIWSTVPGGSLEEILGKLTVSVIIVHLSLMDDSRMALGYLMLKPDENLKDVRELIEKSKTSSVYIDKRIAQMNLDAVQFRFVTDRGENLVRKEDEELILARDLYSEICLVLGQDIIDMMIDSESCGDVKALVKRPLDILDHRDLRMAGFERHHSEIRSIDWVNDSIIFGAQENLLFGLDSLKERRSPEQLSDAVTGIEVCALCSHTSSPLFYTACTDGTVQAWNQNSKYCTRSKNVGVRIHAMDLSPDGYYLAVATIKGCLVLQASNLDDLHWIHYRPHRICSINTVRFSFNGHHLATGTSEGRIDFFDVHGRMLLTSWLIERLSEGIIFRMELDMGALEIDFSDGVLLCTLIQKVLSTFADGRKVTELAPYALMVERAPSFNAWKNRPKTYAQKRSLVEEGLQVAYFACAQAQFVFEENIVQLKDPDFRPWETQDQKETTIKLILKRLDVIRRGHDKFQPEDLIGHGRPVDRNALFDFFRFLRAMDMEILNGQKDDLQEIKILGAEMQNMDNQLKTAEREVLREQESIEEMKRRIIYAEKTKAILLKENLQNDLKLQEKKLKRYEERLHEIRSSVKRSQKKYDELLYKIDRSNEDIFIFFGTGSNVHSKPVTHIDWSKDGRSVQSASLDAGEVKFWSPEGFQRLSPSVCVNQEWASHHSPFGWNVKGLTRFESMGDQHFTVLNRGPIKSESSHLLGIGDSSGRVLLTGYPFPFIDIEIDLNMAESFVSEIGFDRATFEYENELISEVAVLLRAKKQRITIVHATGRSKLTLRIGPPIGTVDRRSAFELAITAQICVEDGKVLAFNMLKHCRSITNPAISTGVGHVGPVSAVVFDATGPRLISVGKTDRIICVWRILRPGNRKMGRRIHDKFKRRVFEMIRRAIEIIRLGEGARIEKSLIIFLREWDVAKSGVEPQEIDPVIKMVNEMKTVEIKRELENRGISVVGLAERDELAARLCTARTTPNEMSIAEIRAEIAGARASGIGATGHIFERQQLLELLMLARKQDFKFPRPIPFEYQRLAPTHEPIILRARARWEMVGKQKESIKDREKNALEILDAVCRLDLREAKDLGLDQNLRGLIVLIKSNRLEIASTCARRKLYEDTVRKGIDINVIRIKDPTDVDELVGPPPKVNPADLKKTGYLYQAAAKCVGGSLLSGQWFQFKDFPGRNFQYTRFDRKGEFFDQLCEISLASLSVTSFQPLRVPGLKTLRWGTLFYAKVILNTFVKAQTWPPYKNNSTQRQLPTAYLYQVPIGIPRLLNRRLPSSEQIEVFFQAIDKARIGLIEMKSFEELLTASIFQCEVLGLPVQDAKDASLMKDLIFSRVVLTDSGENRKEIVEFKDKIRCSDLVDFLIPNLNAKNGHLVFKVKLTRLQGEVKIGLIDVSQIPHGLGHEVDWHWPDFPTWYFDTSGSIYQFGRKISQASTRLAENDVVIADLDQNMGVLRFFKEGEAEALGMILGVQGIISCAVQFSYLDDEVELLS